MLQYGTCKEHIVRVVVCFCDVSTGFLYFYSLFIYVHIRSLDETFSGWQPQKAQRRPEPFSETSVHLWRFCRIWSLYNIQGLYYVFLFYLMSLSKPRVIRIEWEYCYENGALKMCKETPAVKLKAISGPCQQTLQNVTKTLREVEVTVEVWVWTSNTGRWNAKPFGPTLSAL